MVKRLGILVLSIILALPVLIGTQRAQAQPTPKGVGLIANILLGVPFSGMASKSSGMYPQMTSYVFQETSPNLTAYSKASWPTYVETLLWNISNTRSYREYPASVYKMVYSTNRNGEMPYLVIEYNQNCNGAFKVGLTYAWFSGSPPWTRLEVYNASPLSLVVNASEIGGTESTQALPPFSEEKGFLKDYSKPVGKVTVVSAQVTRCAEVSWNWGNLPEPFQPPQDFAAKGHEHYIPFTAK